MPRSLSWNAALRDLRSDRAVTPAGFAGTRAMVQTFARTRGPLVVGGQYDRKAIMAHAAAAAKLHQGRYGSTWAEAMSIALRGAWQLAKAARTKSAH